MTGDVDVTGDSVETDSSGQLWIKGGDSQMSIFPKDGYVITEQTEVSAVSGTAAVVDDVTYNLTGIGGQGELSEQ